MTRRIVRFSERSAVREEAGAWIIRLDGDEPLSAAELDELREWLARSAAHREELARIASLWGDMNVLTELAVPLGKSEPQRRGPGPSPARSARGQWYLISTAAAIGFVLAVAALVQFPADPAVRTNGLYATAVGQQKSVTLVDGSVVDLNTDTQIQVSFEGNYRDIRLLQGEAHFTVAKDERKPFRVFARNGRVQAIGTSFSVYLRDATVDVTVTEGRVAIAALQPGDGGGLQQGPQGPAPGQVQTVGAVGTAADGYVEAFAELHAGESVSLADNVAGGVAALGGEGGIEILAPGELERRISWREGYLSFQGDSLADVVREISRYTSMSIDVADPSIGAIKIGGRFRVGETQAMLDAFEANFGLQVTHLGADRVLLSRTGQ